METLMQPDILTKTFSDVFLKNKDIFSRNQTDDIQILKNCALDDFQKLGIPSKKSERYKYTDLQPFFNKKYGFVLEPDKLNIDINQIFKCDVPQLNMQEILLINGFYYHKNTINGYLPNKVWIGSLQKAITEIPEIVTKYIGKAATPDDGTIALNTALFLDGIFVHIPKGVELKSPLQIINVLLGEEDLFVTQRNLIVLEENSKANIVFCDHTLAPKRFLTNSVTEFIVGENAHLDYTNLQNEHNDAARISNIFINQQHSSSVNATTLSLHGGMIRNNIKVKLDGEGAESCTNGLFLTDKNQHVDNYIFVEHAKPHCQSSQLIKGVLDDSSTGSFNGRILVARDAQKTVAYQKSSNLLLTNEAKMNTRPQLEIYADDVKCSHGATVGQLDQEALFYMRARGIGKEEARLLLMYAFAHEIIQNIKVDNLRFRLDEMVNKRLRKELSKCHNCQAIL